MMKGMPCPSHVISGRLWMLLAGCFLSTQVNTRAAAEDHEFFERHIRPVLVAECQSCHNHREPKSGLALDHAAGWMEGGKSGPAIRPGDPEGSLLMQRLEGRGDLRRMPKDGAPLDETTLGHFREWIRRGAPDPRDQPPTAEELSKSMAWEHVRDERAKWWSFLPLQKIPAPVSGHPVDALVGQALKASGTHLAPEADRRTLLRRLHYTLVGLPPTWQEVQSFMDDRSPDAYERRVEALLDSPAFGERWARHWMDWVRYAESHGSEGDPQIPYAWRFRDYLIRALNQDVPMNQLIREQLAGDLLQPPRRDPETGLDESRIGAAQLRMVLHGFAPTDALDELVRFTDNQIDVVSKAFMGMTLSCSRCHHHKFDPLSQEDYYAWFGVFSSARPAIRHVTDGSPAAHGKVDARFQVSARERLAHQWRKDLGNLEPFLAQLKGAEKGAPMDVLSPVREFLAAGGKSPVKQAWQGALVRNREAWDRWNTAEGRLQDWRLDEVQPDWVAHGTGTAGQPVRAGAVLPTETSDRWVDAILPGGSFSHLAGQAGGSVLGSPRFPIEGGYLYLLVAGEGDAAARYAIQNYPRSGTVFPVTSLREGRWRWVRYDTTFWKGDEAYIEMATAADQPVLARVGSPRSWFGLRRALYFREDPGAAPDPQVEALLPLLKELDGAELPQDLKGWAALYQSTTITQLDHWLAGTLEDEGALWLNGLLQTGVLSRESDRLPEFAGLVKEWRQSTVPESVRVPGVMDGTVRNAHLFIRGNHKQPSQEVPRRFLEILDDQPFEGPGAGRLQLAEAIVDPSNPLTPRVLSNRIWHHVFGRGLVSTVDNFGRLGTQPDLPQVLDWLAQDLVAHGWSMKHLVRRLVTSATFRQSSTPGEMTGQPVAATQWNHYPVRRLEAEAIRDTFLRVSGLLEDKVFGPPVDASAPRRSVYVRVIRNQLDPFLTLFDAPVPVSTHGAREVTNVPAQSLTLMNDPMIQGWARAWADRIASDSKDTGLNEQVRSLFLEALQREPEPGEQSAARRFLQQAAERGRVARQELSQLDDKISQWDQELAGLENAAWDRYRREQGQVDRPKPPVPLSAWDFVEDARDRMGLLDLELRNGARLDEGALVVDGQGAHAVSGRLPFGLKAKTLEVWVQLANTSQKGAGVMTVQTPDGRVFDSIVFAERRDRQWLAGSDHHRRSLDFGGLAETEATRRPVHLAVVYQEDGTILGYRDGVPYGKPYAHGGLQEFEKGETVVSFGVRHLPPVGNRRMHGRILQARLYDRALSPAEVAASAGTEIPPALKTLLTGLSPEQRQRHTTLSDKLAKARQQREALSGPAEAAAHPNAPLRDLAHALFNLKSLIYLE